jgi:DNA polymerase-3 subunit delta
MAKSACWLFLGPEIGEKQDAIDAIRKSLAAEAGGIPAEETVYYAGEAPVPDIVSALRNGSLFADTRLFFIKNADAIKNKSDTDLLASYIRSPADSTVLVFISEENSVAKALEKAAPPQAKRVFYELPDSRKTEWVAAFFRREGCRVDEEGIQTILELVENNTDALRRECSRLVLFFGKDTVIAAEDIEKWLSHTREESAFTLFSRIALGDFPRGIESLRTILAAKESPQAVLAGLSWCFRKLRSYLSLAEAGVRDEWEFKKIGVSSPKAKKDYAGAGRRYDSAAADTCLALTAEYDFLIRSASSFPAEILMEQYLYKLYRLARDSGGN